MSESASFAGFGRRCITPRWSSPLAGFARERWNLVVRDDLFVRALALTTATSRIAILSVDIIWLPRALVDRVRNWAAREFGLPAAHLMMAATHTHSGPEIRENSFYQPKVDFVARAAVFTACCEALAEAFAALQPSEVTAASGSFAGAVNRRKQVVSADALRHGRWRRETRNLPNPGGPRDATWSALWVTQRDRTIAVVNFACHPTFLRGEEVSADFPGELVLRLRESGVEDTLFLQGCSGNVVPDSVRARPFPIGNPWQALAWLSDRQQFIKPATTAEAEDLMRAFASGVAERILAAPRHLVGALTLAGREVAVPLAVDPAPDVDPSTERFAREYATWCEAKDLSASTSEAFHIQRLDLTPTHSLVAFEGEMFAEYACWLRSHFARRPWTAVVGCANGLVGYLPTRTALVEGGYETHRAQMMSGLRGPFAADTEERIHSALRSLLEEPSRALA